MATLRTLKEHYRDPRSIEAIHTLDDPSAFAALPARDSREIILQLFFVPSFEPITSWTVYRPEKSFAHVRRVRWHFAKDYEKRFGEASVFAADGMMPKEDLDTMLHSLSELSFSPFRSSGWVTIADGESFGLRRIYNDESGEVWWSRPPHGWDQVATWYASALARLDAILPMSTDPGERTASVRFTPASDTQGDAGAAETRPKSNSDYRNPIRDAPLL